MPTTQYIGSRYVPLLADPVEWSAEKEYEPLTIVTHEGNSYTSRQFVPKGIDITNGQFWAMTGNYNAQIELYRRETANAVAMAEQAQTSVTEKTEYIYVKPEDYGAVGNGVNDDSSAFTDMLAAIKANEHANKIIYLMPNKNYLLNSTIRLDDTFVSIVGNGATLYAPNATALVISENSHHIVIDGVQFKNAYQVGSQNPTIAGLAIAGPSQTARYQAHDIAINNCTFSGGVFGMSATSCMNLSITNCNFGAFVYKPEDGAGGYAILLQSCVNVIVSLCHFVTGTYGRHSIYVSVSQAKIENIESRNVCIKNCLFDNSQMVVQSDGKLYAGTTTAIVVRSSDGTTVENCTLLKGTALVAFTNTNGDIHNARVIGCNSFESRYFTIASAPNEARSNINFACVAGHACDAVIDGCILWSSSSASFFDVAAANCNVVYKNAIGLNAFNIGSTNTSVHIENVKISNNFIRLNFSGTLKYGHIDDIFTDETRMQIFSVPSGQTPNVPWKYIGAGLKRGYYLTGDGSLRYPDGAYVAMAATVDNGILFTCPWTTEFPDNIIATALGTSTPRIAMYAKTTDGKLRFFNVSDGAAATNYASLLTFD